MLLVNLRHLEAHEIHLEGELAAAELDSSKVSNKDMLGSGRYDCVQAIKISEHEIFLGWANDLNRLAQGSLSLG